MFFHRYPVETTENNPKQTPSSLSPSVTQFSLEHGVQVTLEVKTDLFAFSKVTDGCTRTQEYLIDSTTVSMAQCMAVFAAAGVRPSFINSLAAMAPSTKTGNSQAHEEVLKGKCTSFATNVAPTTVPPNWLTTPYVITRTTKLTASFGFVGPTSELHRRILMLYFWRISNNLCIRSVHPLRTCLCATSCWKLIFIRLCAAAWPAWKCSSYHLCPLTSN